MLQVDFSVFWFICRGSCSETCFSSSSRHESRLQPDELWSRASLLWRNTRTDHLRSSKRGRLRWTAGGGDEAELSVWNHRSADACRRMRIRFCRKRLVRHSWTNLKQPQLWIRKPELMHRQNRARFHPNASRGGSEPQLRRQTRVRRERSSGAPQRNGAWEVVHLFVLREEFRSLQSPADAPAHSHRRETLPLHNLRKTLLPAEQPAHAPEDPPQDAHAHVKTRTHWYTDSV